MRTILSLVLFLSFVLAVTAADPAKPVAISIKVTGEGGALLETATVAVILKSGAYQDAILNNGVFMCQPTGRVARIYVGCEGYEGYSGPVSGQDSVSVTLKASPVKSSVVIHRTGELTGIEGHVNPILDSFHRTYLYATKIGLVDHGKPLDQPIRFTVGRPIDAVDSTGKKFRLWIKDITQEVSLVEYTQPAQ
jgi:hypothetical protein